MSDSDYTLENGGLIPPLPPETPTQTNFKPKPKDPPSTKGLPATPIVLGIAFVMAVLSDWLFWDEPKGWCIGAYGLILGGLIIVSAPDKSKLRSTLFSWLTIAMIFTSIACVINYSLLGLILGLGSLAAMAIISRFGPLYSIIEWQKYFRIFVNTAAIRAIRDMTKLVFGNLMRSENPKRTLQQFFMIILVAGGLSIIFIWLFALANPIIESHCNDFINFLSDLDIEFSDILRLGQFFLFGLLVCALMRFRMHPRNSQPPQIIKTGTLPKNISDVCLVVFNIIFLIENILDIRYLFGGAALPKGMTYAEYAQRGFYALWIAAMLAAAFMIFAWPDKVKESKKSVFGKTVLLIWIAQNGLLLICALYRLYLYVCAYSLTLLRVAAAIGMILVIIGLVGIVIRILRTKTVNWLINLNAASVAAALITVALLDVSGMVARFNVNHCYEISQNGPLLDVKYLEELGPASIPALVDYNEITAGRKNVTSAKPAIRKLKRQFREDTQNWKGWTLRRYKIARSLERYKKLKASQQN